MSHASALATTPLRPLLLLLLLRRSPLGLRRTTSPIAVHTTSTF
jgi:hypothetical protein